MTGAKAPHYPHPIDSLSWFPPGSALEAAAVPQGQCWVFVCARSPGISSGGSPQHTCIFSYAHQLWKEHRKHWLQCENTFVSSAVVLREAINPQQILPGGISLLWKILIFRSCYQMQYWAKFPPYLWIGSCCGLCSPTFTWVLGQLAEFKFEPFLKKICNIGDFLCATIKKCHLGSVLSNPYFWCYHQFCFPFWFHLYLLQHLLVFIMSDRNRQHSRLGSDAIRKHPC